MSIHPAVTVFLKEVKDNLRDRRALMTVVIIGPLMGPLLFAVLLNMQIEQSTSKDGEILELPAIGAEHAPNLVSYLASKNIDLIEGPDSRETAISAVTEGQLELVLIVSPSFGEDLAAITPATLELITDQANNRAEKERNLVRRALHAYNQELAQLRLTLRGVNAQLLKPLNIDEVDVSTPSGRAALLLGMLSYFFIFALLMGGMNLAIDATAGERERGSLEPLLCLPVNRDHLIYGKIAAACVFMALSLLLSLSAFFVVLKYLPLEDLGMSPNFGADVVVLGWLLLMPMSLVGAALMTLVASFTRSFKEAQSWVSAVLLAPTLPIIFVSILMVRPSTPLMFIPSLSQHLLLVGLVKNEPLIPLHIAVSVISTILIGLGLTWVCARLYRREALLG